jgi:hypothetical protein
VHEPNVWYHVAGPQWEPGKPLWCWNRLIELGILTETDWEHQRVPVGFDGDRISLFDNLSDARDYASSKPRLGERIVRVRFPQGMEAIKYSKVEEVSQYPGCEIPAEWLEVVGAEEAPWQPWIG